MGTDPTMPKEAIDNALVRRRCSDCLQPTLTIAGVARDAESEGALSECVASIANPR